MTNLCGQKGVGEMKKTTVRYCQVCGKDFKDGQIVYYVTIDNSIVCSMCASEASKLTNDIKPRLYEK